MKRAHYPACYLVFLAGTLLHCAGATGNFMPVASMMVDKPVPCLQEKVYLARAALMQWYVPQINGDQATENDEHTHPLHFVCQAQTLIRVNCCGGEASGGWMQN